MPSEYRLVFDVSNQSFKILSLLIDLNILDLYLAFLIGAGVFLISRPALRHRLLPDGLWGSRNARALLCITLASAVLLAQQTLITNQDSKRLIAAQQNGAARTFEGCLQGFHPMPPAGHDDERLKIDGQVFSYSDFTMTSAFHQSESHGGPVHADSRVKISAIDGDIIRLEVADHACAAAPDVPR